MLLRFKRDMLFSKNIIIDMVIGINAFFKNIQSGISHIQPIRVPFNVLRPG
jgi:hypothetical protein